MKNQDLIKRAKKVLNDNWNGSFTRPAPGLYPHQWNWDAGFIAIGLAHFDWERAVLDLKNLFSGQWSNGMLPHIVFGDDPKARYFPGPDFWQSERSKFAPKKKTSGITQPPVFGFVLWRLYNLAPDKDRAKEVLEYFYPKIVKLHQYLYSYRDPNDEGLPYIMHPWSPGTDNSPTWDNVLGRIDTSKIVIPQYTRKDLQNSNAIAHRPTQEDYDRYVYLVDLFRRCNYDDHLIIKQSPFLIQDPLFIGILERSNECLIKIAKTLGKETSQFEAWYAMTKNGLNDKLWNPDSGLYDAYDLVAKENIPIQTSSGLIPLFSGIADAAQVKKIHQTYNGAMFSGAQFWTCPTYNLQAPDINYQKYWRGPIWINMNWLLYQGFQRYHLPEAEKIKKDSLALATQFGFFEYFDPRKNIIEKSGYGTNQFSWTAALILDFLCSKK